MCSLHLYTCTLFTNRPILIVTHLATKQGGALQLQMLNQFGDHEQPGLLLPHYIFLLPVKFKWTALILVEEEYVGAYSYTIPAGCPVYS